MIVVKTPLRISFAGGGSDMNYFYNEEPGAVISTAIDKYIYIIINKKFDNKIRASYSRTEIVNDVEDLQHELIRESLKLADIDGGIEIVSIADIPSSGTGLGSSSAYIVGLLNALYAYKGVFVNPEYLAQMACNIEIDTLNKPIGKQDQYIAAYGGWQSFRFYSDETVDADHVECLPKVQRELESRLILFYTGINRSSEKVLTRQKNEFDNGAKKVLREMVGITREMRVAFRTNRLDDFGELLEENWQLKKRLNGGVSNVLIDMWYRKAKKAGAIGGKICGAGGGGFLLFYAPQDKHSEIARTLQLKPVDFSFEPRGSRVMKIEG